MDDKQINPSVEPLVENPSDQPLTKPVDPVAPTPPAAGQPTNVNPPTSTIDQPVPTTPAPNENIPSTPPPPQPIEPTLAEKPKDQPKKKLGAKVFLPVLLVFLIFGSAWAALTLNRQKQPEPSPQQQAQPSILPEAESEIYQAQVSCTGFNCGSGRFPACWSDCSNSSYTRVGNFCSYRDNCFEATDCGTYQCACSQTWPCSDTSKPQECNAICLTDTGCQNCQTGSCDRNGCSNSCSNCWPVSFYCQGHSSSGCGDLHSTFLGYGIPAGSIRYGQNVSVQPKEGNPIDISSWCTTVQADSNSNDGACIVVYIGDNGEWCIDNSCNRETQCSFTQDRNGNGTVDENDLDWECRGVPSPSPSQTPWPSYRPESLSCEGLTRNPATALKAGDNVIFECSNHTYNIDFSHYNYRRSSDNGVTWEYPSNWQNKGGDPFHSIAVWGSIPAGNHIVECQACSATECTNWGALAPYY